jgi:hypothetical protein
MVKLGVLVSVALGLLAAGCGANSGGTPAMVSSGGGGPEYAPLSVGLSWTYQVTTATGNVSQHPTTVEAMDSSPAAGQPSFRIRYELPDTTSLRWEQKTGTTVVRYEDHTVDASGTTTATKIYSPSEVVLDESTQHETTGATWVEMYGQAKSSSKTGKTTQETAQWTVLSAAEMVTVPAGTYTCLKVQRIHSSSSSPSPEVTWYAAGVGKVKETGAGPNNDETLELVSMP